MSMAPPGGLPPAADGISRATHFFFALCVGLCVGFGGWAWFGELDIVSVATGEAKPSSQVKEVQHLEGGIVAGILIREGQTVKEGQALIELEATRTGADVEELNVRLANRIIEAIRHTAEATGLKRLVFSPDLVRKHKDLIDRTNELFETRRKRYGAEIASQKELIIQRRQEMREIKARLTNTRKGLKLLNEQVKISNELLKDKLTNRYNHIQLLREAQGMKSQIAEDSEALTGAKAAFNEAQSRLKQTKIGFREDARSAYADAKREIDELTQRARKFADSLRRMVLRAPVGGVVKTIHVTTIGGVVRPGDTVVDIVPGKDKLIIEAQLPTQDIGYVQIGQEALLKLNSPDLSRFGSVTGKVVGISPDKLEREEDGMPYYRIRIAPEKTYFTRDEQRYDLYPGTQVMASIRTGKRTVVEYLLDPFLGSFKEAMRER